MVATLFESLRQQSELMQKYQHSSILEELEIALLAKSNVKALKEAVKEQIAFDEYFKRVLEKLPNLNYKAWKDYE